MASDTEVAVTVKDRGAIGSGSDPSELPRGTTIDRYVLIDKIGQGGMGVVYSAYDHVLNRRVAVKLMTSGGHHEMLLAEARAMAQLSHPAIVPVHDVGEFRGQVFLAMAFIDGTTLRSWQTRGERPWQELVAMYRQIGEGLAFAHDGGIIHRDFKPDNVLVDRDGRPHITDFGLAKIVLASDTEPEHVTTTVAGTPGYMSPQQSSGKPTDATTDQFAYCVSLFEALHGGLPWNEPPLRTDVPRGIVAAIERGFADDPAKRWPSMRELLAALAPAVPTRRRNALVAGASIAALAIAFAFAFHHGAAATSCKQPQARELWQAKRAEVQAAFAAQPAPAELVVALDGWTTRWTAMAEGSCQATARGSQSSQLLDLRARCLDHALEVTSSLIDLASRRDPDLVRHAASVGANLPSIEPCADAAGLLGVAPLPANPALRGEIAMIDRQLAHAMALVVTESFREASGMLDLLAKPVAATGYVPLQFELYDARSTLEVSRQSDPDAAAAAAWAALAVDPTRKDARVAGIWIDLVWIVGVMQHAPTQAIEIGRVAEALEARDPSRSQMALLDHRLATVLAAAGKLDDAVARYERARAGFAADGNIPNEVASLSGEAQVAGTRGDTAKQLALLKQAIDLAATLPHAPALLANQLSEISLVQMEAGNYDVARTGLRWALDVIGTGEDAPAFLAAIHGNLGNVAERQGDLVTAETEYRTEVEIARTKLGPDVSDLQIALYNLGDLQNKRHEFGDAAVSLRDAEGILQRSPREAGDSSDYASPGELALQLVTAHLGLGRPADAVAAAEACLALAERDGVKPGTLADVHFAVGTAVWAAGDQPRARATMRVASAEYRTANAGSDDADHWLATH